MWPIAFADKDSRCLGIRSYGPVTITFLEVALKIHFQEW